MPTFTAKQRVALGKKIREGKDRLFPARGGCNKFASEVGVTPQLLSCWMSGTRVPDPAQLVLLAKVLDISILELCAIPKIRKSKKLPSAYDIIADVTNVRKNATKARKIRKRLADSTSVLNRLIKKELDEFL